MNAAGSLKSSQAPALWNATTFTPTEQQKNTMKEKQSIKLKENQLDFKTVRLLWLSWAHIRK